VFKEKRGGEKGEHKGCTGIKGEKMVGYYSQKKREEEKTGGSDSQEEPAKRCPGFHHPQGGGGIVKKKATQRGKQVPPLHPSRKENVPGRAGIS